VTSTFTTIGIVAGALISLGILLNPFYKRAKRWAEWMERFMRDWEGEEESPGRDRVAGVMERLNNVDGELSQNGGFTTVKDRVDRLYENQALIMDAFVEMGERLISIENCLMNTQTEEEK
jgi:hypothetical protein